MFKFLLVSLFFSSCMAGAIVDANCTVSITAGYAGNAFSCENEQADLACTKAYPIASPYELTAGNAADRPFQCYSNGTSYSATAAIFPAIKDMAIATCAKQCGYCCMTPEFTCDNARFPRINCNTVTDKMCKDPLWRQTIAEDCPSRCGFCLLGGCIDAAPDCATQPSICVTRGMESFVASNCQRTCDQCSGMSTTAANGGTCTDSNSNCASWAKNGFCNNNFYGVEQRRSACARTCGLC